MSTTPEPGHEKFSELCALAMAGSLTASEDAALQFHLQSCAECREEYARYLIVTREGMPWLAQRYAQADEEDLANPAGIAAEAELGSCSADARDAILTQIASDKESFPGTRIAHVFWAVRPRAAWSAVAACLLIVSSYGVYRFREHADGKKLAEARVQNRLSALASEKEVLSEQLRTKAELLDQAESERNSAHEERGQLQRQLHAAITRQEQLSQQVEGLQSTLEAAQTKLAQQLQASTQDAAALTARMNQLEAAYQNAEAELVKARSDRDHLTLRLASLEDENKNLTAITRDQQRRLNERDQYLASDRDIRELMGARQLYMADVFDVSSDSRTRKPYGRIFYTKGRSLIFYAFDLDRQHGIQNASFQAWGRNESSQNTTVNLGILYQDSDQNRRWVLRFDDAEQLADIDAVFVTVEPQGGSQKPTGKPFLYASLRHEPNHP
jgi:hypothetical protein